MAVARAFSAGGGREVLVTGYKDQGNEPLPSYLFLIASVVGFAAHLPFLDRAERRAQGRAHRRGAGPWQRTGVTMDLTALIAGIEEGGLSWILFTVMVVAIYLIHRFTISR